MLTEEERRARRTERQRLRRRLKWEAKVGPEVVAQRALEERRQRSREAMRRLRAERDPGLQERKAQRAAARLAKTEAILAKRREREQRKTQAQRLAKLQERWVLSEKRYQRTLLEAHIKALRRELKRTLREREDWDRFEARIAAQTEREVARKLERLQKQLDKVNAKLDKAGPIKVARAQMRLLAKLPKPDNSEHPRDLVFRREQEYEDALMQYRRSERPTKPNRDDYDTTADYAEAMQEYRRAKAKLDGRLANALNAVKVAKLKLQRWEEREEYIRECIKAGIEPVLVRRLPRTLEANHDSGIHLQRQPDALLPPPGDPAA